METAGNSLKMLINDSLPLARWSQLKAYSNESRLVYGQYHDMLGEAFYQIKLHMLAT